MSAVTVVNEHFSKAPSKRTLVGDKTVASEPAVHIVEFPGGAIELSRLQNGDYWAHIIVNRGQILEDLRGRESAHGIVVDSRVDWAERRDQRIPGLPDEAHLTQLAVLIRPVRHD